MIEVRFTNEPTGRQFDDTLTVLSQPRLWIPTEHDYPRHTDWLDRTADELQRGHKRALLAYAESSPMGVIIYRPKQDDLETIEIRNISINPAVKGRLFGSLMLRQVEHDYPDARTISVDTKITNEHMISFLESQGYGISAIEDLYGDNTELDALLTKSLDA